MFTAAIGLVQTFAQLLLARMFVAVGEAGSAPASQSILGDLYPHGRRAGPIAVFSASVSVGVLIGLMAGGVLDAALGWRMAFFIVGLPGLALTLGLAFLLKEPPALAAVRPSQQATTLAGLRRLWSIRAYRGLVIAAALHLIAASALNQWIAAYLMRTFALGPRDVGLPLGLLVGGVGGVATIAAGLIADRLARRRPQWLAWLPAIAMLAGVPLALAVFAATSFQSALLLLVVPVMAVTAYTGPLLAAVQFLAPAGLRTPAAGLMMLVGGVFGQAPGPLLVGLLSDQLAPMAGTASLGLALAAAMPVSLIAAAILWKAGGEMRDMPGERAQAGAAGGT